MNRASKRQNKKSAASVQALIGIKVFTDYGLLTNSGELLFYLVTPTNLSVLSSSSIESKIRQLTLALSAIPELEIACTDSAECLDGNNTKKFQIETEKRKVFQLLCLFGVRFVIYRGETQSNEMLRISRYRSI